MGPDFTGPHRLLVLLWIHGRAEQVLEQGDQTWWLCGNVPDGREERHKHPCSCPRWGYTAHPRGQSRSEEMGEFQTQPKGLTYRNADGFDVGCEEKN